MKKLVLFFYLSVITNLSIGQTDEITFSKSPQVIEIPKTITLANGKVISYKKWCRQYDRGSRRGVRKIKRQMRKEFDLK